MEIICPICNGLASYIVKCTNCGNGMEARGAIQDYFDDYSPYLSRYITEEIDGVDSDKQCLHLFYCWQCETDRRIAIDKMIF